MTDRANAMSPESLNAPWMTSATCRGCGYPLRDLSEPRCPECGRAFDPYDPRTMRAPGWFLTRPYTRRALCRRCAYPLRDLPSPRCPECATPFDPENPRTMRIPGYKPPRESRLSESFGRTMITLAIGAMLISVGSAYSDSGLMLLYGLRCGVPCRSRGQRDGPRCNGRAERVSPSLAHPTARAGARPWAPC